MAFVTYDPVTGTVTPVIATTSPDLAFISIPSGSWPILLTTLLADLPSSIYTRASVTAASWLYRLTGKQFGFKHFTLYPSPSFPRGTTFASGNTVPPSAIHPYSPGTTRFSFSGNSSYPFPNSSATCGAISSVTFGNSSITLPCHIQLVTGANIAGADVPAADFQVFDNRTIIWDNGTFPGTNNLGATSPNKWSIDVVCGPPFPEDAQYAMSELAEELAKALTGAPCSLPRRAVSVSRQGVNLQLVSGDDFLSQGLVGITSVDQFIRSVNPHLLSSASSMTSPDTIGMAPHRRTF